LSDERPLPTGTVTFLRTDVEGSMGLVRELGSGWDAINATHMGIIRRAVDEHRGMIVRTEGDAMFAVFPEAGDAVAAAVAAQRSLRDHAWPEGIDVRVRIGLHSGSAHLAGDDYGGFEVNRAARIAAAGHGGQILLSDATRALVDDALPDGVAIRDLGSHVLKDVPRPERLYQLDVPGLRSAFPGLRTAGPAAGDLPVRRTSFVGRDGDLAAIAALLAGSRLVTITGPGGIGKTSVALETARLVEDRFPDGAWFVGLADVEDPSLVRSVIARTIGLFDGPGRPAADALGPYLKDRAILLMLDNFEHLLAAAGDVAGILDASPRSRVLVTSRAPLRIAGEQEYPLDPLGDACARLFVERARAVRPGWDPATDGAIVDEVCSLVDRLPLGVELVAARVAHLPLRALRDRLAAHQPLPGSGPRDVPDRQRTLASAIAWSHDLLSPASQRVLHDLAVFDVGFDLEQAETVVERPDDGADVLDHLVELVDQSLIQRDVPDASGDGVRFRLLETIRGFALERLRGEDREEAARHRHAEAYLALAERAAPNMPGPDQPRWLDRLTVDYPNLRAAMRWSIDAGEVELAQRLVAALWRFWQQDGRLADGTELAEATLRMPGADTPTEARMKAVAAAGSIAYWHGRQDVASTYYAEELAIAERLGDVRSEADANWNLSFATYMGGDPTQARAMSDRALELFEEAGDELGAARVGWSYLTVASADRSNPGTLDDFLGLLARFERLGDIWYAGQTMLSLSWALLGAGETAEATRWYIRALAISHGLRDVTSATLAMPLAAMMAVEAQRPADAARVLGAFDHFGELYGVRAPIGLTELLDRSDPHGIAQQMLGPEGYHQAFGEGRQMTLAEAVALAAQVQEDTWGPDPGRGA
jgi:predicted ATPase/class 3 adenylate cyclase